MSKRLILILALAFVVGITFAAYAEVQNVKVSGDIAVTGVSRTNLTLTKGGVAGTTIADFGRKINGVISQARVRVDADLTDNVAATVRLLNERVWGEETQGVTYAATSSTRNNNSEIDLDLAYVTMKEFLYSPLSLTIGRQELRFGNGLIIGDPDTNAIAAGHLGSKYLPNSLDDLSLRKAFDAVRATLDYNPLVVDLIYSKISESNIAQFDDVNLYGMNANYAVNKNISAEGYVFQRARDRGVAIIAGSPAKKEKLTTVGAGGTFKGDAVTLGLEGAYQFGDHLANTTLYPNSGANTNVTRRVNAFALQAMGSYKLPRLTRYAPMLGGSYTYLSGDKAMSTNDNYRGWDSMFEDQNGGTIFNKIFALTNMQILNLNASAKPIEDVTVTANYYNLRSVQPFVEQGTLTKRLSNIASDPTYAMKPEKKGLGNELDLGITYDYTEDVQFGLCAGAFIPGGAFEKPNRETAKQVIGSMKVTF